MAAILRRPRTVAYYVNWAVYDRQHYPSDLPLDKLSHVLYAFAKVDAETGEVTLTDTYADLEKPLPPCPTCSAPLSGAIPALVHFRDVHHPHLKLLISIGGWSFTPAFASATSTPARRQTFATSALALIQKLGLDGVDVDWEYPASAEEGENLVGLLRELRLALNAASRSRTDSDGKLLLTIAAPSSPWGARHMSLTSIAPYLDWFNVMTYDFAGPWSPTAGHASNLFPGTDQEGCTWSVKQAVDMYLASVEKEKIVVGCPLFGRQFVGTEGAGKAYKGVGQKGSWEGGVWDWKDLPLRVDDQGNALIKGGPQRGEKTEVDMRLGASSQYVGHESGTFVTWDSIEVAKMKGQWVKREGLGGIMWWESSGDGKGAREGSVIETVADILHGP